MRIKLPSLLRDRRGIAATEFALIAPALIFLVMGVLEMSFRFRASEEATRYVHEVADLVSRETTLTTSSLNDIYEASTNLMKPLETTDKLDLDVSSVGFKGSDKTPTVLWRRVAGAPVTWSPVEVDGMAVQDESVIRVGVRYSYTSVLSSLFGGRSMAIVRTAITRPRQERLVSMDGKTDDGGGLTYFGG